MGIVQDKKKNENPFSYCCISPSHMHTSLTPYAGPQMILRFPGSISQLDSQMVTLDIHLSTCVLCTSSWRQQLRTSLPCFQWSVATGPTAAKGVRVCLAAYLSTCYIYILTLKPQLWQSCPPCLFESSLFSLWLLNKIYHTRTIAIQSFKLWCCRAKLRNLCMLSKYP